MRSSTETVFVMAPTGAAPVSSSWNMAAERSLRRIHERRRSGIDPREALKQKIDLCLGARRQSGGWRALSVESDGAASLQHIFAHRQTDARLLFIAQERQMRVEQVMRLLALAGPGKTNDIDEHIWKGIAGHGAVGAALHLEIKKQAAGPT